ncbi:Helix-turn-helix [Mucilaginibacter sp. OK268]|uniref:helix-turn-helix domain-containing protein n=1 Tax=Mucilaginibacter sp. OK268 TaxID=1881048 RepID=UPI0008850384|nr:helix-turn-helix transcriptional regulator [Mucilaginibacter sp. OK268]SDP90536.1 Helix-turn-helix [Mucilaginibacter sp. OK268]
MIKGNKQRRNEKAILTLATNIRKYRQERNLTIEELANLIEVDYSQIGRMERGIVNPNISIVFDIAKALGIKASQLLEE